MGFRSTFVTEDWPIEWPDWFVNKYSDHVWINADKKHAISSKREGKTYGIFCDLAEDIRKAINWDDFTMKHFVLLYLHECGGITRCQVDKDSVRYSEPDVWKEVEGPSHWHCTGCSDI